MIIALDNPWQQFIEIINNHSVAIFNSCRKLFKNNRYILLKLLLAIKTLIHNVPKWSDIL